MYIALTSTPPTRKSRQISREGARPRRTRGVGKVSRARSQRARCGGSGAPRQPLSMRRPRPLPDRRLARTEISCDGILEAPGAWPLARHVGTCDVDGGGRGGNREREERWTGWMWVGIRRYDMMTTCVGTMRVKVVMEHVCRRRTAVEGEAGPPSRAATCKQDRVLPDAQRPLG